MSTAIDEPALAGFDSSLLSSARQWRRPAGATLFRCGQRPVWMFYVRRGEAQMRRVTESGTPVLLQRARAGFIAEASLTSPRYHCDAACRTACDLLAFPLASLREAIDRDPSTRWAWIGLLGGQLRQQRARIERQSLKTVRERVQHLLHTQAPLPGHYELRGTRTELAAELGVTPEALYRCLSKLQAEGTLSMRGSTWRWAGP